MIFGGPPTLIEDLSKMLEEITQSIKELNKQFVNPVTDNLILFFLSFIFSGQYCVFSPEI